MCFASTEVVGCVGIWLPWLIKLIRGRKKYVHGLHDAGDAHVQEEDVEGKLSQGDA